MKIYHICSIFKPSNGIYFVLKNLVPLQRQLGNEVLVLNTNKNGYTDENVVYCSYKFFHKLIESDLPNIVIFHGVFNKRIIPFSHLVMEKRIPYLIELHGALSKQNMKTSTFKKYLFNTFFLNNIIKKATGIIYLNQGELSNSTVNHLNNNHLVIPNGCEYSNNIAPHCNDKLELIFIGRLDIEHKGLDIMIPAVKKAYKNGINLHLSIYGRGYEDELKWLNKELNGYEGIIDFYGEVFGVEKQNAFLKADVLLLTSRYEGFPIVVLEALSYGVPCIVTPNTNVGDLIKNNNCGWVSKLSVEGITSEIQKSSNCDTAQIKKLSENCINTAKEYTWEKIAEISIKEYHRLIT